MSIYSVSEINSYISDLISSNIHLKKVMIRGEISNFKFHSSGHCYLTLKDNASSIKAVIFRRFAQKLRFRPENGQKVIACGSIGVYDRDGVYQLYVEQLIPDGVGELNLYYEQLKKKLDSEGLFSAENKKALPLYPKSIGIITSRTGAVLHDIFHVASQRNPAVKLFLFPVLVQGDGSVEQIVSAIKYFNQHKELCDVLIIGRGGGSMEDLWSFNDEQVVRAVFASEIPIVSAVGHETDCTLTDFASDVRASTPSHAAEICVPAQKELLQRLSFLETSLNNMVKKNITKYHERLNRCLDSIVFTDASHLLDNRYQQLDTLMTSLCNITNKQLTGKKHILDILSEKLSVLDPKAALKRGYSMIYNDEIIVNSISQLNKDEQIRIILSDGQISATVNDIMKGM